MKVISMAKMSKEDHDMTCWRSDKKEYAKLNEKMAKGKKLSQKELNKLATIKAKCGL